MSPFPTTPLPQGDLPLGVWQKFCWAMEHRQRLVSVVSEFLARRPYAAVITKEEGGLHYVARLNVGGNPPAEAALILGDVLHNARACLDYLVWHLAEESRPEMSEGQKNVLQFPIADNPESYKEALSRGRLRGVPDSAEALIEQVQPYRGSDERAHLWSLAALRDLTNTDKHRILHLLAVVPNIATVATPAGGEVPRPVRGTVGPLRDGDEILRCVFNADPGLPENIVDVDFSVTIAHDILWEPTLVGIVDGILHVIEWEILNKFRGEGYALFSC